ncbi:hypothetical protein KIN_18680 [Litoreibacter roseus]|uniref:Uncharacterized protein n=1 Tax=Litoreibacter roseus TaxID=2601869 RepID=A0A6N6JF90_9RHOB|nr:hypothetical protein KIN_18680 [Litoreibacter roseus]
MARIRSGANPYDAEKIRSHTFADGFTQADRKPIRSNPIWKLATELLRRARRKHWHDDRFRAGEPYQSLRREDLGLLVVNNPLIQYDPLRLQKRRQINRDVPAARIKQA